MGGGNLNAELAEGLHKKKESAVDVYRAQKIQLWHINSQSNVFPCEHTGNISLQIYRE